MGAEGGQPDIAVDAVIADAYADEIPAHLRASAPEFSFFQAIRLMQRVSQAEQPIGSFQHPKSEPVRLAGHASLAFPPGEIQSLDFDREDGPPKMTVNFFGMHGPLGVLPTRYTELMIE